MLSICYSAVIFGIEANIVKVETDINNGLPGMEMVGMLAGEVKEAKERVRIAIKNCGFEFPQKRITVNISPADMRKTGTAYDLAIAAGILSASAVISQDSIGDIMILGELAFNGEVNGVKGVLSGVIAAKNAGLKKVMVPLENYNEAALIKDMLIVPVENLPDALDYFREGVIHDFDIPDEEKQCEKETPDFADVKGQFKAKRAAEICAAGMHNLLLAGPPGTGKTLIARRIPTIMPELNYDEKIELTKIYSVAGKLPGNGLINERPFRDPHHSVTRAGLIGGGNYPMPGEISYANYGILFIDEFPEIHRETVELLRIPLEEGKIVINRINGSITYPAHFTLVAAMNRCPCGYYPDRNRCRCMPNEITRYLSRISQPILDRIDLKVDMPMIRFEEFDSRIKNESSASIRTRVLKARKMQEKRYAGIGITCNSALNGKQTEYYCTISESSKLKLKTLFEEQEFSARAYYRILKTARTVADLEGSEKILDKHINEALKFKITNLKE